MDATEHARRFHAWLDSLTTEAHGSAIGFRLAEDSDWQISHTGGGCLTWHKSIPGGWIWITDEGGTDLGKSLDERFLVGIYAEAYDDGCNCVAETSAEGLEAALAYVNDRTAWTGDATQEWLTAEEKAERAGYLAALIAMQTEA